MAKPPVFLDQVLITLRICAGHARSKDHHVTEAACEGIGPRYIYDKIAEREQQCGRVLQESSSLRNPSVYSAAGAAYKGAHPSDRRL